MWKKIKRYLAGMSTVLILSLILNSAAALAHQSRMQQGIAEEVLRFHVLANSDSEEDQNVKLEVRNGVLDWIYTKIKQNCELANKDKAKMTFFLKENQEEIEAIAVQILKDAGMDYGASVRIGRNYFPDRTYGTCTFPAGWYDTLQIGLGDARGRNWWCVLYPELCFSDYLHAVVEEDSLRRLEEVLTVEEYESLLKEPKGWKISFRWF